MRWGKWKLGGDTGALLACLGIRGPGSVPGDWGCSTEVVHDKDKDKDEWKWGWVLCFLSAICGALCGQGRVESMRDGGGSGRRRNALHEEG